MKDSPTEDTRVHRSFPLLTNGKDEPLDALNICYTVLSELKDGADIAAALDYLRGRFSARIAGATRG